MSFKWDRSDTMATIAIFLIAFAVLGSAFAIGTNGTEYVYEYTVKSEQVYDGETPESHVDFKNISETEQKILYSAFKKKDHFFGSASVVVRTEEKLPVMSMWRVIEVRGVPMLVAISGPEDTPAPNEYNERLMILLLSALGGVIFLVGMAFVMDYLEYRNSRVSG